MNAIKEAHYNLGIAYLEAGQYNRAVPEFEAAIKLDPDFIGAHSALCRAYLEQDELENAGAAVATALKLDANYQPALLLYGTIIEAYHDRGKAHLDEKRYTEAVAAFLKAVALAADLDNNSQDSHPENTHIYVHLGAAYIGMKAYQEAIEALQLAIAKDADLVDAHYNLGYAYVEQGVSDEAIPHLERAIAIAPHLKGAHYNLARAYRESGNLEAATNAITETLRLDPNYQRALELADTIKQAHYNRGITYLNDERYSEAVTAFQNAITLDSDFAAAHYNLGLAYLKMEAYPRAVPSLEKTVVLDPNHKAAYHALALAYLGQQALGKARDAAREALKIDANYQPVHSLLEAIDPSYKPPEIVEIPPSETDPQPDTKSRQQIHYELGAAYLDSKMHAEAIAEFQKAIDIDPGFVAAYMSLGTVYLEVGQLDEAENAAKAALRVDADSQPARQLLDDIKQVRPIPSEPKPTKQTPKSTDPLDTKQDLERGQVFLSSRQYDQAAAAFKRVIKVDASSVEAHYGLGQAYLEIGAFDDAKAAAETALTLNPNHRKARELIQVIKFASNIEKNRKIRKKVLSYVVIVGVIIVAAVVIFKVAVYIRQHNGDNQQSDRETEQLNTKTQRSNKDNQQPNIDDKQSNTQDQQPNRNNQQSRTKDLIGIAVSLEEPPASRNGILDAGENARLVLTITNKGSTVNNVAVRFQPSSITGVNFRKPASISTLSKIETIRIPIRVDSSVQSSNESLKIQLLSKNGKHLATKNFPFRINQ